MGQFLSCRARSGPEKQSQSAFRSSSPGCSGRAYADTGQPGRETKTVCTGYFKVIPPHSEKQDRVASGAELLRLCLINCFIFQTALFSQIFIKKTILSVKKTSRGCRQGKRAVILPAGIQQSPVSPDAPGCRIPGRPGGVQAASMGGRRGSVFIRNSPVWRSQSAAYTLPWDLSGPGEKM